MANKIFINYRREDSISTAGRLHDRLAQTFGRKNLFMDVDHIPAGVDFHDYLDKQVTACDVFLAVIGPNWLDAKDEEGRRRFDNADDFVTIEIAAALARNIRVIPVLVDGARTPKADKLPESIKALVRRNAVEIRNTHFGRDAEALVAKVREALQDAQPVTRRWPFLASAAWLIAPCQRRTVAVSAMALLLVGWVGLYQIGVPVWVPWAQTDEQPANAEAEARAKAEQAEKEPLAAAKAEEERHAEAIAKRKAEEAGQSQQATPPPGSPLIGRSYTDAAKKLTPVAPPPVVTPADKLPTAKLKAPTGFKIEVYASGIDNARTLRLGDKGTVFACNRIKDKIYAIIDKNGKREVKVIASGLYRPNGIVLHNGTLYIAELHRISKIDSIEANLDNPPKPTVIFSDLPKDEAHGWKYLTIGPENKLYFQVGAPCNICLPSERHSKIYRLNLDGSGLEVVASGIRQIVGMDWHPTLKQLYFTENSRDWLSEDTPQDTLNRVTRPGKDNFGFPYCHPGGIPDQEFGWGHSCGQFSKRVALLGPHVAPLGMRFYTGAMFPSAYRNQIIIARHGSWNRTDKAGGDLLLVRLNGDGSFASMEPFVTGFLENNNYTGRPVDVLVMKDGSLLVSDDYNGAVYRVSYRGSPS